MTTTGPTAPTANESPVKRKITASDLWGFRFPGDPQVSPDGRRVAFVLTTPDEQHNAYNSSIYMVETGRAHPSHPAVGPNPATPASVPARQFTAGRVKDATCRDHTPRWAPDGSKLAFISNRSGKNQLWLIDAAGGEATQLTNHDEPVTEPVWSPDSRQIAFVARVPRTKEEKDAEDKRNKDVTVVTSLRYKANGIGIVDPRPRHIFAADVETGSIRQVTSGEYNESNIAWSPDGSNIAFIASRRPDWEWHNITDLYTVPAAGGDLTLVTRGAGTASQPAWSPDGKLIAFYGHEKGEDGSLNNELMVAPATPGAPGGILSITAHFDRSMGGGVGSDARYDGGGGGPVWSGDGRYVYFSTADGGHSHVYRAAVEVGRVEQITPDDTPGVVSYDARPLPGGAGEMLVYHSGDFGRIGEIYAMQAGPEEGAAGKPVRLTGFNDQLLSQVEVAIPERLTFTGAGGVEIEGWIMKPAGFEEGNKYPLVLEIHGGPAATYGHGFMHEFQLLCARGIGVLFTNPQGSQGYGERFCAILDGDWGGIDYRDFMAATDYAVATYPWVDAERLGVAGGSYGGYAVNWIVGQTTRFAAAVTMRCISNMYTKYGVSDIGYYSNRQRMGGADLWDEEEFIMARSPMRYAPRVRTPMLIIHGEQDMRCPIEQGEQWYVALKRLGNCPVEFIRFAGENHELSRSGKPRNRIDRLERIVDWFAKYLKA